MNSKDSIYTLFWCKKIKAVNLLGGKCVKCGNSNIMCLDFHHKRDKENELGIFFQGRWSKIEKELVKCELLCRNCHQEKHTGTITRCSELKGRLLEIKGVDRCMRCGYKGENYSSLDFHHRDTETKDFSIGNAFRFITTMRYKVEEEIEKCDVICRNCHAIEHFDSERFNRLHKEIQKRISKYSEFKKADWNLIRLLNSQGFTNVEICKKTDLPASTVSTALERMDIDRVKIPILQESKICPSCKKDFLCVGEWDVKNRRYCSRNCKSTSDIKLNITKEELVELLKTETYSGLARKYSVVPNTVRNLAKRYGLILGV